MNSFDSTLNGVLDSADYVATWLVEKMEDAPTLSPIERELAEIR